MFLVYGMEFFGSNDCETTHYGIFSSEQNAKDAIEIFVERFMDNNDHDEEIDEEDIRDEYRENFKIVEIGDIDDDSIFREKKIPCF